MCTSPDFEREEGAFLCARKPTPGLSRGFVYHSTSDHGGSGDPKRLFQGDPHAALENLCRLGAAIVKNRIAGSTPGSDVV